MPSQIGRLTVRFLEGLWKVGKQQSPSPPAAALRLLAQTKFFQKQLVTSFLCAGA